MIKLRLSCGRNRHTAVIANSRLILQCAVARDLGRCLGQEKSAMSPCAAWIIFSYCSGLSLVGLARLARDSGQTHGKRSIRGGRPRARQALYMPALNAIRFNPEFKAKYEAMVKAGKPAKVAI